MSLFTKMKLFCGVLVCSALVGLSFVHTNTFAATISYSNCMSSASSALGGEIFEYNYDAISDRCTQGISSNGKHSNTHYIL